MIVQSQYIAGVCCLCLLAILRHERDGVGDLNVAPGTDLEELHARPILSRCHAQESDPVVMLWIHVRLNLEDETRELFLVRVDCALLRFSRAGCKRMCDEGLEEFLDAEVVDRGAEKHGRQRRLPVALGVERMARAAHQLHLLAQLRGLFTQALVQQRIIETRYDLAGLDSAAVACREKMHLVIDQVVYALEPLATADWPCYGRALDVEHRLDLVHELHRVAGLAIELIDERHDGCGAHATHFHELDGAFLDAFGTVDDHEG